jgi:hypothetical protein
LLISPGPDPDLVRLDDALTALAQFDARKARVVELKFFVGLDLDEIAEALEVSRDTMKRDWRLAKVWLRCEVKDGEKDETGTRFIMRLSKLIRVGAKRSRIPVPQMGLSAGATSPSMEMGDLSEVRVFVILCGCLGCGGRPWSRRFHPPAGHPARLRR